MLGEWRTSRYQARIRVRGGPAESAVLPYPAGRRFFQKTSRRYEIRAVVRVARSERLKRLLDVSLGFLFVVIALPALLVTAAAVLVADGRPVLFRQWRVGRDGVPFRMYKFRTMVHDAEARLHLYRSANERKGPLFKLIQDPRVTRLGGLLRRWSLDELPQLFNVLRGDMSLVGPRPALPIEVAHFSSDLRDARCRVKPGVTGLWQVHARDDPSFAAYEQLDIYYGQSWTLAMDIHILVRTPLAVFRSACKQGRSRGSVSRAREASVSSTPSSTPPMAVSEAR